METDTQQRTEARPADMADPNDTKGKEMVPSNGAPPAAKGPQTQAQRAKAKLEKILTELKTRAEDYHPLLAVHGVSWEYFVSVIKQAVVRSMGTKNNLLECTTASILEAAGRCAKDGLMPDGKSAAIVKFADTATYMPMYQGMLEVAYDVRDGAGALVYKDIETDVIYQSEVTLFEYRRGDDGYIRFSPPLDRDPAETIAGAYCIIRTNNGGVFRLVMGAKELAKVRAVSRAKSGPNSDWPGEMAKKAPLRRLLKITPKSSRLQQVLTHDEETYTDGAVTADAGGVDIPSEALFDDTIHDAQVEDGGQATDDAEGNPAVAQARIDLMAADSEEKLDAVIANINKETNTGRKKSGAFSEAERDELLGNAEQLRAYRWPKAEAKVETPEQVAQAVEETVTVTENEVVDHVPGEDFVQVGADGPQSEPAQPAASEAATQASSPSPAPSDTSPPTQSAAPTTEAAGGAISASPSEWKTAAPEDRMTPMEAELADPELGIHFKKGINPNANGQVPIFNGRDEIVCWSKPDRDAIPWREMGPTAGEKPAPAAAPPAAAVAEPPAAEAAQEPQIRANPEDRQGPEDDDAGGYGDASAETFVYRLKAHPAKPPKEYADPYEWKDAIIFRLSSLDDKAAPRWWADNKDYVEAAIPHAKVQAGKVIVQAVARKLPGAKELVDQYGPFQ